MKISEFLSPYAILTALDAGDKSAALEALCAPVAARYPELSRRRLKEVLEERERLGSTGIGDGVAIPHGKLPGLPGLTASFARSTEGIEFESLDGRPAHIFFALFAPENSAGVHLKALARISRLLKSADLRAGILEADTADEIYRLVTLEDEKYG